MKAITIVKPGVVEIRDLPKPQIKPDEALIHPLFGGICGSDLNSFRGTNAYMAYPRVPGHEFSAEIVEIGANDRGFKAGDIVTANPYFNCGHCYSCQRGLVNACMSNQTMGVQREGGFAEFVAMPISRLISGKGLPPKTLALIEPFCIGYHGIQRAGVKAGDKVLVVGAGTIGVLAAIAAFFFVPVLSMVFVVVGLFIVAMQLGIYKKFIDWAFPKKTSCNVIGTKKPTGEVKRRILFNGHPDAVWEWRVNYHFGGVAFDAHAVSCVLAALYYFAVSLAYVIKHGVGVGLPDPSDPIVIAAFVGFVFLPFLIGLYFMVDYKTIVDGANDNLSGCYMGIALLKFLQDSGITFENTEIGVLNTGSEEAGTRGSKAFAKQHKGEFDDVPTVIYSFDTIHDPQELMVNYRDLNGLFKTDKAANDLFYASAQELNIPCKKGWVPPFGGSTDTIAFHRGGIRSAGITGLNHKQEDYYHTRKDSYDNLNLEGLANCFAVTAKVLEKFDEGMLDA